MNDSSLYRILDASANRACEALRVLEDYVRFVRDDAFLTEQLKTVRHGVVSAIACFPMETRLAFRETQKDVGTTISVPTEFHRESVAHVLAANFSRLQESLRSLEEFSKISCPEAAHQFEQMRYLSYTLQRAVRFVSKDTFGDARFYALVDTSGDFPAKIERLLRLGTDVFQLRDKGADDRTLVCFGRQLRTLLDLRQDKKRWMILNDRADLCVVCRADGVHVGQEELTVRDARRMVGDTRLVGVSTHTLTQARQAVLDGADYIGCGPTFPSGTKAFDHFPGLDFLRQVAAEITLPAFAIGGITAENVSRVYETGFTRVACAQAAEEVFAKS
ncbi:MAG: thiamine phosphate synthase [Planctomycetia bacterium]|nr:thiamine phosphate synthase [Planctomycetia bacterium]